MMEILRGNTVMTILLLMCPCISTAQETPREVLAPSSELIEFLGEFKDDDVGFVDPISFLSMDNTQAQDGLQLPGGEDEKD